MKVSEILQEIVKINKDKLKFSIDTDNLVIEFGNIMISIGLEFDWSVGSNKFGIKSRIGEVSDVDLKDIKEFTIYNQIDDDFNLLKEEYAINIKLLDETFYSFKVSFENTSDDLEKDV